MNCAICGPDYEYNVLYRCQFCNLSICERHLDPSNHGCRMPEKSPQQNPSTMQFRVNIPRDFQYFQQRQEPTPQQYERALRANPSVLTSGRESIDLFIGFLLITFVISSYELIGSTLFNDFDYFALRDVLLISIVVAPAFILHELGHKYSAIYYGKYARFTLLRQMTQFTILVGILNGFGLLPIAIAGPGATMIMGRASSRESGIFSASGPLVNLILAFISLGLFLIFPDALFIAGLNIFHLSVVVNAGLGLFNLIPVSILDGKKIYNWSKEIWASLLIGEIFVIYLSFIV